MSVVESFGLSETIAGKLASFAADLRLGAVPESVRTKAKLLLLDMIGAGFASASFDFGRRAMDGLMTLNRGDAVVIGFRERLALRDAVLMNGILVHGLDYDDTSIYGRVHPSSSCGTTALGVASHRSSNGTDLLTAYIAALECTIRLGAVVKGGFQQRGFHPTGVVGTFGAAIAAGLLFGLSPGQLAMAQGIALSMAAGSQEFATEGAWTKRIHRPKSRLRRQSRTVQALSWRALRAMRSLAGDRQSRFRLANRDVGEQADAGLLFQRADYRRGGAARE
jgi:2-methylcitrate dehydratase PrpD